MARTSRTYRLGLSQAGLALLIEAHCRQIRATGALLAWGTSLHIALHHLSSQPTARLIEAWVDFPGDALEGDLVHHLGAPLALQQIATDILARFRAAAPGLSCPRRGALYIVALQHAVRAQDACLREAYRQIVA